MCHLVLWLYTILNSRSDVLLARLHGHLLADVLIVCSAESHTLFCKMLLAVLKGWRSLGKVTLEPRSARAAILGSLKEDLI